jgi:hypothetical protein
MTELRQPFFAGTRLAWTAAIVAPLVAAVLAAVPWIPSWSGPVKVFSVLLALAGVTAALCYAFIRIRSVSGVLSRATVTGLLGPLGLLLLSAAMTCLGQFELFPPSYAFMIEASGARVYVYDTGFLDPEVTVRVQRGPLPIHAPLFNFRRCASMDVKLDPDGHTLHVCGQRCDLRTRRCNANQPPDPDG